MRGLNRDIAVARPVLHEGDVIVLASAGAVRPDDQREGAARIGIVNAKLKLLHPPGIGQDQAGDAVDLVRPRFVRVRSILPADCPWVEVRARKCERGSHHAEAGSHEGRTFTRHGTAIEELSSPCVEFDASAAGNRMRSEAGASRSCVCEGGPSEREIALQVVHLHVRPARASLAYLMKLWHCKRARECVPGSSLVDTGHSCSSQAYFPVE